MKPLTKARIKSIQYNYGKLPEKAKVVIFRCNEHLTFI